jgi:hypothetical protein
MTDEYLIFAAGVLVGMLIGKWVEAWAWRVSAEDFRTRESAGREYVVLTGTKLGVRR